MTRLVILNQKGGVAKTTTVHTFARFLADQGRKVLITEGDLHRILGEASSSSVDVPDVTT